MREKNAYSGFPVYERFVGAVSALTLRHRTNYVRKSPNLTPLTHQTLSGNADIEDHVADFEFLNFKAHVSIRKKKRKRAPLYAVTAGVNFAVIHIRHQPVRTKRVFPVAARNGTEAPPLAQNQIVRLGAFARGILRALRADRVAAWCIRCGPRAHLTYPVGWHGEVKILPLASLESIDANEASAGIE